MPKEHVIFGSSIDFGHMISIPTPEIEAQNRFHDSHTKQVILCWGSRVWIIIPNARDENRPCSMRNQHPVVCLVGMP